MKSTEGKIGRVFILRLEDGDVVPNCLEQFAAEKGIKTAQVVIVGGLGEGEIIVGPRDSVTMPPDPVALPLDGAHEVAGVGVLAPDENGKPVLHIHGALGRSGHTITGCLRKGVKTWLMLEAVIMEILDANAMRVKNPKTGFVELNVK